MTAPHRGRALFYLALTLGYMGGIYWLSSLPGDADPEQAGLLGIIAWTPPALQNLLHVPLFGLLAWLWHRSLDAWGARQGPALVTTFVLSAAFGVFDEWHQLHVPGRYASFTDITLNCTGVMLVLWLVYRGKRRHPRLETGSRPPS